MLWRHHITHWGRVTHICVSKLTIIGSNNGLSPGRRQAIIWTNAGILSIGQLGINFSEMLIKIHTFSFKKMRLQMSSGKWRPSCLDLNVLISCTSWHISYRPLPHWSQSPLPLRRWSQHLAILRWTVNVSYVCMVSRNWFCELIGLMLTHLPSWQNGRHVADDIFKRNFCEWKKSNFEWNFTEVCS